MASWVPVCWLALLNVLVELFFEPGESVAHLGEAVVCVVACGGDAFVGDLA